MPPPEHEEIMVHQLRKLRREVRLLRYAVIFAAIAICAVLATGPAAFVFAAFAAGLVIAMFAIIGTARLLADGWDAVSMRWQRSKWQAERNKAVDDKL